jgi:hypothetical protein
MNKISIFNFKDQEVAILYRNGELGYTFEVDGKSYGNRVKVQSKSVQDIASATFLLFTSFVDTLEAVKQIQKND